MVLEGYSLPAEIPVKPTAIVDGGANIGMFTLQASARFRDCQSRAMNPTKTTWFNCAGILRQTILRPKSPQSFVVEQAELFFHPGQSYSGFVTQSIAIPNFLCAPGGAGRLLVEAGD